MTIYRLYTQNGHCAGFWIQHRSWQNVCARVEMIAGKRTGPLPGNPPAHDQAPVAISGFDVRSGRPVELELGPDALVDRNYTRIAEPAWSHGWRHEKVLAPA